MSLLAGERFDIPGYDPIRSLSDRERSKIFLARAREGPWVALKLERPANSDRALPLIQLYQRLSAMVGTCNGFVPLLDCGMLESCWIWHAMPLADNLPGLPALDSESGVLHYTPLTLAAWTLEHGPSESSQVARWGRRLCAALAKLHQSDLVHRDVKPANLLFIRGDLCLGDYGLVGEPGSAFDCSGTEGFVPLEGSADPAADVFALGKTLYQAWSGKDRLEFPSLPDGVTEDVSWEKHGRRLNDVILRACHREPNRRYRSAEELSAALEEVLLARDNRLSRRRWLATAASIGLGSTGYWAYRQSRPVATLAWRRVRDPINVEYWRAHFGTVDWRKRRIYSLAREKDGLWLHTLDLNSWALTTRNLDPAPGDSVYPLLQPDSGKLWAAEGGLGNVFVIDAETGSLRNLGGGPCQRKNYGAALYWNPITGRLGTFGGYGYFSVHNRRHEFDAERSIWVEMIHKPGEAQPWPRLNPRPLFHGPDPTQLVLVGGKGSPSGRQGDEIPELRGYNGQFHWLDDIWILDLRNNRWNQVLPNGAFPLPPQEADARSVFYHPGLGGIIVLAAAYFEEGGPERPTAWLVRPGLDQEPQPLGQNGDISRLGSAWSYALDPRSQELVMLGHDGVYRIGVQRYP